MHLSDADLAAAIDPSGGGASGHAARAHAATCEACTNAIETAQAADREVGELLRLLDHAVPSVAARFLEAGTVNFDRTHGASTATGQAVLAQQQRRRVGLHAFPEVSAPGDASRGHSSVAVALRRGAVILALSAAAAAAAVAPHSPVRQLFARISPRPQPPARVAIAPPAVTSVAPAPASPRGVAIGAATRVDLDFQNPQATDVVRIRPAVGTQVSVTASADGPTYTVGSGTVIVDSHGTPGVTYDVQLPPPATLPHVSIRVGSRVLFARDGDAVHSDAEPRADGSYVLHVGR